MVRFLLVTVVGLSIAGCAVTTDDQYRGNIGGESSSDLVSPMQMRRPSAREASRAAAARAAARAVEEQDESEADEGGALNDVGADDPDEMIGG